MRSSWSLKKVLTRFRTRKLVAVACYLGIVSLLMMAWSVLFKAALPIVVGMGFGQVVGVIAFLLYALAVLGDIYRGDVDEVIPPSHAGRATFVDGGSDAGEPTDSPASSDARR